MDMLRKTLFLTVAAVVATLAMSSRAQAWGCYHYGYHYGGFGGGGYHYGGYHYGGYGGGFHYGYVRRW
jgi:hypothetical protein